MLLAVTNMVTASMAITMPTVRITINLVGLVAGKQWFNRIYRRVIHLRKRIPALVENRWWEEGEAMSVG